MNYLFFQILLFIVFLLATFLLSINLKKTLYDLSNILKANNVINRFREPVSLSENDIFNLFYKVKVDYPGLEFIRYLLSTQDNEIENVRNKKLKCLRTLIGSIIFLFLSIGSLIFLLVYSIIYLPNALDVQTTNTTHQKPLIDTVLSALICLAFTIQATAFFFIFWYIPKQVNSRKVIDKPILNVMKDLNIRERKLLMFPKFLGKINTLLFIIMTLLFVFKKIN